MNKLQDMSAKDQYWFMFTMKSCVQGKVKGKKIAVVELIERGMNETEAKQLVRSW